MLSSTSPPSSATRPTLRTCTPLRRPGRTWCVVDVRSDEAWAQGRITGAVHMPYREIAERAPAELDPAVPVVVYCWSPGCNAGAKGAIEFAKLGYSVREMIGGYEYWVREGQPTENDEGPLPRVFDAQVMVVAAVGADERSEDSRPEAAAPRCAQRAK